ncbi:MAG: DUF2169 domain-containing protein [Gammaproteobacteria bacterium HGW-Gammaproteobacteria-1]|jgi:hypothetical protein|nr:MAG: DUF2169 domain-containing protein [Gammaproteobacteria bacterium HGW-Gammaproteobacteria-1]
MLEIRNHTPLTVSLIPGLDKHGVDYAVVVMKGKFQIVPDTPRLLFSEEPAPIIQGDVHYGEPDLTSVRYASDIVPYKVGTDIVVNGHAYAPNGRGYSVDAVVQVGNQRKTCRVFGDRYWDRSSKAVMTWAPSQPEPFERMPVIYENAYGGIDKAASDETAPAFDARNPVGKGFVSRAGKPEQGISLPNLEDPQKLIQDWKDQPPPAGFGFICRSWQPRIALAGTYDEQWKKQRMPLLPMDFDERYFNGAHPDLITQTLLRGGERVMLSNLSPSGQLTFDLPVWSEPITFFIKDKKEVLQPTLDTVVIEPDSNSVQVTWRASLPCHKQFLYLDTVVIGKKRPGA